MTRAVTLPSGHRAAVVTPTGPAPGPPPVDDALDGLLVWADLVLGNDVPGRVPDVLLFAAREVVEAVDRAPAGEQPDGWRTDADLMAVASAAGVTPGGAS